MSGQLMLGMSGICLHRDLECTVIGERWGSGHSRRAI
jgi:hypothetical protein